MGGSLSAQTNSARMLSGTNTIISCPYQIQAADVTKLDVFNSSAFCVVSLPSPATSGFGVGTIFSVKNDGTGTVTITPTAGTISGSSSLQLTTGQGADIYSTGAVTGDSYEAQQGGGTGGGGGGNIYGTITNSVFTANNSLAATFNVQGLPLGNGGAPVTSCPYTVQPDTAVTTVDRGTVLVVNSAIACSLTINDPGTSGMGNSFPIRIDNYGAGTVTVNRQTSAVFNVITGSGAAVIGATSFTIAQSQFATLHSDNGTNWYVEKVTGGGGSGTVSSCGAAGNAYYSASGTTVSCDTSIVDNGAGTFTAVAYATSGSNGGISGAEGTGANAGCGAGIDCFWEDSTAHAWRMKNNNGTTQTVLGSSTSDFPDVKIIPAANCVSSVAGGGWNTTLTPTCIAGSNNLGGYLPFVDASAAQFEYELPLDWDTASQPFIAVHFLSGANATGTVIFQAAVACYKSDGSTTSDPAFNAADVMATKTMAAASRGWSTSVQSTHVTSGNSCVPGGTMIVKLTRNTDTASTAVFVTKAVITTPRFLAVQAN